MDYSSRPSPFCSQQMPGRQCFTWPPSRPAAPLGHQGSPAGHLTFWLSLIPKLLPFPSLLLLWHCTPPPPHKVSAHKVLPQATFLETWATTPFYYQLANPFSNLIKARSPLHKCALPSNFVSCAHFKNFLCQSFS